MDKVSIRFFNDKEVRAVWDEENSKWWFSVLDIIGVLNAQNDYEKNRNYWKYLKAKLKKENNQLGSVTTQFKLTAPDGKKRLQKCTDWSKINKNNILMQWNRVFWILQKLKCFCRMRLQIKSMIVKCL